MGVGVGVGIGGTGGSGGSGGSGGVGSPGIVGVGGVAGPLPIEPGFTVPGPQVRLVLLVLVVDEFVVPPPAAGVDPVDTC
ncbi:hypothetical protein GCM10025774_03010 [Microbacterium kyungheense]